MGARASPKIIGRYAIYSTIASGGMASVSFGRLLGGAGFSRTVAIKRLHPHLAEDAEFIATMIDEARLAARISHPNVVSTLDVVSVDGELLLVMDYVRGESLSRLLKAEAARDRRLPLPTVSAIAIGALQGLHAAHEATSDQGSPLGIVHRDVSPQNILVGIDGMTRVIDFGVAKAAGRLQTTREGVIKGKMAYMAPEQLASGAVTRAADVYAMSVVLWEMLAGRRLFEGDSDAIVVRLVLDGARDPPSVHAPDVPPELDALVMKGLAGDAADRFATAGEMAEALVRVLPPAYPTAVGTWCMEAAREALAKRGALLAEIESGSRVVTIPTPLLPIDVETLAADAASLSPERPTAEVPAARRRRPMMAAALGAGVLLVAGFAMTVFGRTPGLAAPLAAASPSSLAVYPSTSASVSAESPSSAARDTTGSPTPGSSAAPVPAVALSTAPPHASSPSTRSSVPATPPRRTLSGVPPPSAATGAPKPPSCDPPYVIDAAGHHRYKPECI
jgi:serine/threonine-protein kinase